MGGILGFRSMKDQVNKFFDEIPGGILFNAIVFDQGKIGIFSDKMLRATDVNKNKIEEWLKPVNQANYTGVLKEDINTQIDTSVPPLLKNIPGMGKAIQVAIRQGCDTLYMISAGWEDNKMGDLFDRNNEETYFSYLRKKGISRKEHDLSRKFFDSWRASVFAERDRMVLEQDKIRSRGGLPKKIRSSEEMTQIYKLAAKKISQDEFLKKFGLKETLRHIPPPPRISREHFEKYLEELFTRYCKNENKKIPVFNNLLLCAKNPESKTYATIQKTNLKWFKKISSRFKGKFEALYLQELKTQ